VVAARRLTGGLTSLVRLVTVERRGKRAAYVLRTWSEPAPDAIANEAAILTALEATDIPAPRLIATTTDMLLMTRVPGRVYLMPHDREAWLRQMAHMLVRIHDLDVRGRPFESWRELVDPPADAVRPDVWRAAFALVATTPPATRTTFIHRDYQHFNLLWSRERLTGVIDWVSACVGSPDVDVGHCRLNLALLFSVDVAERFRALYEAEAGRAVEPWWDIHALLSYGPGWKDFLPLQIDGRAKLEVRGMPGRIEELLAGALRRCGV